MNLLCWFGLRVKVFELDRVCLIVSVLDGGKRRTLRRCSSAGLDEARYEIHE